MIGKCVSCEKEFKYFPSQSNGKYCSRQCQQNNQDHQYIIEWLNGTKSGIIRGNSLSGYIRRYLLKEADYKCSQCGWSGVNPVTENTTLEIDHIDGNRKNAKKNNLRVLCPNCHSLTPTYKALNIKP